MLAKIREMAQAMKANVPNAEMTWVAFRESHREIIEYLDEDICRIHEEVFKEDLNK
jgi:hypothetical protein